MNEILERNAPVILLRADFNLDVSEAYRLDQSRYLQTVELVKSLASSDATVVIFAHRGRPEGKRVEALSLKDISTKLAESTGKTVHFIDVNIGGVDHLLEKLRLIKKGNIYLLENLRFNSFEEDVRIEGNQLILSAEGSKFAKSLGGIFTHYINNAFSVAHRANLSNLLGLFIENASISEYFKTELKFLGLVDSDSFQHRTLVIGGGRIVTKLAMCKALFGKLDNIILGVSSLNIPGQERKAFKRLQGLARDEGVKLYTPLDYRPIHNASINRAFISQSHKGDEIAMDIGQETIHMYSRLLAKSDFVIVNGPIGFYQTPGFDAGTKSLFSCLKQCFDEGATVLAGGGSTSNAIKTLSGDHNFTHVSTGGGAMLCFLSGLTMPALHRSFDKIVIEGDKDA